MSVRHKNDPALIDSEHALRLFELSLELLAVLSKEGYFIELSPSWVSALGWTLEELKSKPLIDSIHPDDRDMTIEQTRTLAEGGAAVRF
jgi:rsbT co-antagonist protein RsbR